MPRLIKRGCGPLMNTVSISLKLLLPLINMQCSMKEHRRRPADTIFIVGRAARRGARGRKEARRGVRRDISAWSAVGKERASGAEQRQMRGEGEGKK